MEANGSENVYHGGQTAAANGYRPPEDTSRALSSDYASRPAGYNQAASFASDDGGWTDRTQGFANPTAGFTKPTARYGGGTITPASVSADRITADRAGAYGDHFGGGSFNGARAGGGGRR